MQILYCHSFKREVVMGLSAVERAKAVAKLSEVQAKEKDLEA